MPRVSRAFYLEGLTPDQKKRFRSASREAQVGDEIALIRLSIHEALPALDREAPLQQKELFLHTIGILARLIRLQSQLQPDQEDLLGELNESVLRQIEAGE